MCYVSIQNFQPILASVVLAILESDHEFIMRSQHRAYSEFSRRIKKKCSNRVNDKYNIASQCFSDGNTASPTTINIFAGKQVHRFIPHPLHTSAVCQSLVLLHLRQNVSFWGNLDLSYGTAAKHRIYSQYPDPVTNTNRNQAKWLVSSTWYLVHIIGVTYDYGIYLVMQRVLYEGGRPTAATAGYERYV